MGFFDNDSSDEEPEQRKKAPLPSLDSFWKDDEVPKSLNEKRPSVIKEPIDNGDDDDDPLDAFMKTLEDPSKKSSAHEQSVSRKRPFLEDTDEDNEQELKERHKKPVLLASAKNPESAIGSVGPISNIPRAPFEKVFWTAQDTPRGRQWRQENDVRCSIPIDPIHEFNQLHELFGHALLDTIAQKGYTKPTLVQSQTLPVALAGHDCLVTAQTGQGKTLAFLWPLVVHILDQPHLSPNETGPIALVVVPTRELAQQIYLHAKTMLKPVGGRAKAVIGGQGKYILQQELKKQGGVELVVATPGRLLDVCSETSSKKGLSLERVTIVVLDEADKCLQMGFENQVTQILEAIRSDRQTLMLSATMGKRMERMSAKWLAKDFVRISVGKEGQSSQHVDQHVMVLEDQAMKESFLLQLLPSLEEVGRTLVFVATRERCENLTSLIVRKTAIKVVSLHGDKRQVDRTTALRSFARGEVSTMVATDVAGRGLDISNVATVVSFDPAKNLDAHVHRVGRAGRLSQNEQKVATAYILLTPKNSAFARVLKNAWEREHRPIPGDLAELANRQEIRESHHGAYWK